MTPEDQKKLFDELNLLAGQLKTELKKLEALGADPLKKTNETIEAIQARMDTIETKLNRPPVPTVDPKVSMDEKALQRREAFLTLCRRGKDALTPEQLKVLTVSDDTTGGYLAPPEMTSEIIKGVVEYSPVREVARVRQTGSRSVKAPKRTGTFSAAWVGEIDARSETQGLTYGLEEIPTHELTAEVYISMEDLEDSAFNLESELNMEFSEQFGVAEGAAFISGAGTKKPEGLLTNSGIAAVNSGDANLLKADGLIDLFYAVKDAYARNGSWLMKRGTIATIRKFKDGQGQYLWQPGIGQDQPNTILGKPYREAVDMPAVAANEYPVLFGDYRRGYWIVDRIQITVVRDIYTKASSGQVKFVARKRVGGAVVNTEAIKKQKIAA